MLYDRVTASRRSTASNLGAACGLATDCRHRIEPRCANGRRRRRQDASQWRQHGSGNKHLRLEDDRKQLAAVDLAHRGVLPMKSANSDCRADHCTGKPEQSALDKEDAQYLAARRAQSAQDADVL